jgi:hypothetical protein
MTPLRVKEVLDVVGDGDCELKAGSPVLRVQQSICIEPQNDSLFTCSIWRRLTSYSYYI